MSPAHTDHNLYHFRASDQYEIGLVIDFGAELWSLEIKLTTTPSSNDYNRFCKTLDHIESSKRVLIFKASKPSLSKLRRYVRIQKFPRIGKRKAVTE